MTAAPPWREITPDDYHHARAFRDLDPIQAWIAQEGIVKDLLQGQLDGAHRLRLVLREAVDLKPHTKPDPRWFFSYDVGASMISMAEEIVIEFRIGRREVVMMPRGPDYQPRGAGWAGGRR
ncbi:hypothetical protein [Methylobacterium durans]|uniref:Uncharacterized protein n=1 Tax=Methylobacterium durans TaxID=2202825 RepID=A0A2U8WCI2_9HYPH|nr:hypothetical protein [Methylobacterium durans]AWN43769.1 hypothetical protein DK389_28715 [Methylobacterium durans]